MHRDAGDGGPRAGGPAPGAGSGKIFGIGLSRTGAKTLNQALEILGYRSLFVTSLTQLEASLSEYDAFTHMPLAAVYQELDARFPGSRFLLTVRERESWLDSCQDRIGSDEAVGMPTEARELLRRVYGADSFDREAFARAYDRFTAEVQQHFAGREGDLLVIDVCGGDGWEKLCPFLDQPTPQVPFPHAPERHRQRSQVVKRFLVRHFPRAVQLKGYLARTVRGRSGPA